MSENWSEATLAKVKLIYGMGIGTFLIVTGVWFIPDVLKDGLTREELVLVGVVCIGGGLAAALPTLVMQYIGKGVRAWERRRNGGAGGAS